MQLVPTIAASVPLTHVQRITAVWHLSFLYALIEPTAVPADAVESTLLTLLSRELFAWPLRLPQLLLPWLLRATMQTRLTFELTQLSSNYLCNLPSLHFYGS